MTNLDQLAAAHAAAFAPARGWSSAEIRQLFDQSNVTLLGDPRAFVVARWVADEAEILTLATHPEHRRMGLAKDILAQLHHQLPSQVHTIFLEVAADNTAANDNHPSCRLQFRPSFCAMYDRLQV